MNTTFKSGLIALIDQFDIELWKEKKEFLGLIFMRAAVERKSKIQD